MHLGQKLTFMVCFILSKNEPSLEKIFTGFADEDLDFPNELEDPGEADAEGVTER